MKNAENQGFRANRKSNFLTPSKTKYENKLDRSNRSRLPADGVRVQSCPHYNRTQMVGLNGGSVVRTAKKPHESVKLYQDKSEVPGPYDVVAILTVVGDKNEEAMRLR